MALRAVRDGTLQQSKAVSRKLQMWLGLSDRRLEGRVIEPAAGVFKLSHCVCSFVRGSTDVCVMSLYREMQV